MYYTKKGKKLTIKQRLFISNLRMALISIGAFFLAAHVVMFITRDQRRQNLELMEIMEAIRESINRDSLMATWIMIIAFSILFISVINNIITYRMTKRIVKPLEPLNEGVRQIQANNLEHRIEYKGNDEFRPVCEAFNEMAAKLEASTVQQKKDAANRRELIAGISHDLRTPLTSIIGCIEGIETGVASTPEMKARYFSYIKNETANLKQIIEQLFLFSKLDMEEFPLNFRNTNITLAISEIIEDSLMGYENRGLSIKLTEMPADVFVNMDVQLFRNVIVNILENSVKYKTKEQGQMEISAVKTGDYISLRFTDDGPGVSADTLPKLFDVFYRADPSRNKTGNGGESRSALVSAGGSGLGLAISAKIILGMGGSIHAETPSTGGLTIVLRMPLSQSENN